MPKAQAMFRVTVDLDATYEKLRTAGVKASNVGVPVETAQINAELFDGNVTILFSKSMVQINFPVGSDEDPVKSLRDTMNFLHWGRPPPKWLKGSNGLWCLDAKKPARLLVAEPSLFKGFYRINWPSAYIEILKRQIVESIIKPELEKDLEEQR